MLKLYFLLSIFSFSLFAQESKYQKAFQEIIHQARRANSNGDFQKSIQILKEFFKTDERKINSPSIVLFLQSDNYEKIGKYKESIKYLIYYINRKYKKWNEFVLKNHDKKNVKDKLSKIPSELLKAYDRKILLFSKLYKEGENRHFKKDKMDILYKKIVFYNDFCEHFGTLNCTPVADIIDEVKKRTLREKVKQYRFRHYIFLSYMYYQDDIQLKNKSTAVTFDLGANTNAVCIGRGLTYENNTYEFNLQPCLYFGYSSLEEVDSTSSGADYTGNAFTAGAFGTVGGYGHFFGAKTALGVSLSMRYRYGNYEDKEVSGVNFSINNPTEISYGGFLEGKYEYSQEKEITLKVGSITGVNSLLYILQLNFNIF